MTLASSWLDLVIGVDIHNHLVPTPAGPVPMPLPQPYVGLVGNPAGLMVSLVQDLAISLVQSGSLQLPTGPVLVNGFPATTTAESARNLPVLLHLPMPPGVSHVKPPTGSASFPLGVLKVSFAGNSAIRLSDMARSCADPVPMPTSKVVVIPKGPPVMVMGAPGIDLQRAASEFVMGRLIRTAWSGVGRLAKRVARLSGPRLRNLVAKAKCFITGHPVDVATGRVFTEATDFALPGPLPLAFERTYFSSWSNRDGVLGPGWSHSLDQALWFEPGAAVYRNAEGQEIVFELAETKGDAELEREFFEGISRNTLVRERGGWRVVTAEGLIHHFARVDGDGGVLRVVRSTTRNPNVAITYSYDGEARLREVIDSAGRSVRFEHDDDGRLVRIFLPDPQDGKPIIHSEFVYSDDGLLIAARDAHRQSTTYAYDGRLMVSETNRNGVTFYWLYDSRGSSARCLRTWGVDGGETIYNQKLDYDPRNRVTLVTDSYGHKTLYKMNAAGAVIEVTDALGGVTVRAYDDDLQVVSETDAAGRQTKYSYGPRGQLNVTTFPDGSQTVRKYDPRMPELLKLYQTEAGAVWRFQYDGFGQLIEVRGPEPDAYRTLEWEGGQASAVIEASGARTEVLERDRWGNPETLRLATGGTIRREYDARGRVVASTNPYGGREEREHDRLDRLVAVREPDGNLRRFSYDPEGNLLESTDRLATTRFTYACWNRLASREEGAGPGAAGDTVRFVWGQEGELREIRNERNHEYRFVYDPCLRVEREVGFDLQETRYTRDAVGLVTKVEKPGVLTDLTLDGRGRVIAEKHSDGTWSRFAYRKDGELVEAANDAAVVTFKRDALGRVVSETQNGVEVKSHHAAGHRTRVESTLGAAFDLGRDPAGNLRSLSIGLPDQGWTRTLTVEHDAAGLEISRQLPGGVTAGWHYDPSGRPIRQHVSAETSGGWSRSYVWSFDDRITAIDDTRFGLAKYDHDRRGRLVAEHRGDSTIHRAFDEVGNVYRTPDRTDRRYVRGGIIRNDGDTTFAFDLLGNMIQRVEPGKGTWTYAWDGAGMLKEVSRPDGVRVTYAYDALGRRVSKRVGEAETRWVWDGDVVLHEVAGGSTVTWCHEPDSFTPLARVEGGVVHHVVADQLGTPVAMYEATGRLGYAFQVDVFGSSVPGTNTTLCPLRWPGQQDDADIRLYYNGLRYYDPQLGQYISADPLGTVGGLTARGYVRDPLSWSDPLGLIECRSANLNADAIRFSQSNVRSSLPQIVQSMKANGWQGGPIDVVRMPDGGLTAVDNTRLAAASLARVRVKAVIRCFDEPFPTARSAGNLQGGTWGDAIMNRIGAQKPAWLRMYPNGAPITGVHPATPGFSL
jgi:RHS repeat-associated protein